MSTRDELAAERWWCLFHREQTPAEIDERLQAAYCPQCRRLMGRVIQTGKGPTYVTEPPDPRQRHRGRPESRPL